MNIFTLVLFFNLFAILIYPTPQSGITFYSNKQSIQYGQEATLRWKVEGARSVFITGLGSVSSEGSRTISPKITTEYILVAEGMVSMSSAKLKITVEGGRGGDDEYPQNLNEYKYPITFPKVSASVGEQLGRIHTILQDEMQFSAPREYQIGDEFFFQTISSQRDYLVHASETRIRARYISYLVKVGKQDNRTKEIPITISTRIQYIRGGEGVSRKRLETLDTIHRTEAERLRNKINGG